MRLMEYVSHTITYFLPEETGASVMEYALVGLLIAVVCILALLALGMNRMCDSEQTTTQPHVQMRLNVVNSAGGPR